MGQGSGGGGERRSAGRDEPARERARGRERDLLAEDRAHRGLGRVDVPGARRPGRAATSGASTGSDGEDGGGGGRVGVEVEQVAAAGLGGGEVGRIVEREDGLHVVGAPARASRPRGRRAGRACGGTTPSLSASTPGTRRAASQRRTPAPSKGARRARRRVAGAAVTAVIVPV